MAKHTERSSAHQSTSDQRPTKRLGGLRIALLIVSIIAMVAAVAVPLLLPSPEPATQSSSPEARTSTLTNSFLPSTGDPTDSAPAEAQPSEPPIWSRAVFQTGFGFFIGFAIAFAVRSFVKLSLIAVGLFALALFGLEYIGLVSVQWGAISERYDSVSDWLSAQTASFSTFITGQIPGASAGIAGAIFGIGRKG